MNITDAATATVDDYPGGAAALATRVPKGASTLSHEASETHGAKLGARTAARLVKLTGDIRILQAFTEECGYHGVFYPQIPHELAGEGVEHVTSMVKELSDVATKFGKALADGKVTPNERDDFMREATELMAAVQRACEYVEAQCAANRLKGGA